MTARRADAAAWGVATEYEDAGGELRAVPEATVDRILGEMGATPGTPPPDAGPLVLRPGGRLPAGRWRLLAEGGGETAVCGALPPDAPLGYHRLAGEDGEERVLIVSPGRCVLPERAWGWAAQLYALRSARSWGIGDLGDLRRLAAWAGSRGAGALLVNPLHADMPGRPAQPSPYSPSSRLYRNPLYLDVAGVAADRGRLGGPGRPRAGRPGAERRAPDRPRRGDGAQGRRARADLGGLPRRRRPRRLPRPRGRAAAPLRHVLRPGRASPAALVGVAAGAPPARTRPAFAPSPRSMPAASRTTSGSSGCWSASSPRRARAAACCTTWPSGSTAAARTPGSGRTSSPCGRGSAPRRTSSTRSARTGASCPSTPGACGRRATSR